MNHNLAQYLARGFRSLHSLIRVIGDGDGDDGDDGNDGDGGDGEDGEDGGEDDGDVMVMIRQAWLYSH